MKKKKKEKQEEEEEVCCRSFKPSSLFRTITPITLKLVCSEVEPFHNTSALLKGTTMLLKHTNARTLYPSCYGKRTEVINVG